MTATETIAIVDRLKRAADKVDVLTAQATPGPWRNPADSPHIVDMGDIDEPTSAPFAVCYSDNGSSPANGRHIATFDPPTMVTLVPLLRLGIALARLVNITELSGPEQRMLEHLNALAVEILITD